MVETRNQEKTLLELVEEIRTNQERQSSELRQRSDSLDDRYNRLERLVFENLPQLQSAGKRPVDDAGGSQMMDPTSAEPNRPPDPPDLFRFPQQPTRDPPPPPVTNGLAGRLTKVGFPTFDGTDLRDWICICEQFFDLDGTTPELKV